MEQAVNGALEAATESVTVGVPQLSQLPPESLHVEISGLAQAWPQVVEAARMQSRSLQALLRNAQPIETVDGEMTLGFKYAFHRDETDRPENRAILENVLADVTGATIKVRCVLGTATASSAPTDDTDAFIEEAERMLRGVHARQFRQTRTDG